MKNHFRFFFSLTCNFLVKNNFLLKQTISFSFLFSGKKTEMESSENERVEKIEENCYQTQCTYYLGLKLDFLLF